MQGVSYSIIIIKILKVKYNSLYIIQGKTWSFMHTFKESKIKPVVHVLVATIYNHSCTLLGHVWAKKAF